MLLRSSGDEGSSCDARQFGGLIRPRFRTIVPPVFIAFACATSLSASNPVSARKPASRSVGEWTVVTSKDGEGCFLTRDYKRGTTLLLGLDIDGTNRLSVLNPNWSIKPKDQLTLNFRLSNSSYPAHFAVGIVSEGKQGFVTSFGAKFPSYFSASGTLQISRGDVPVERLSLDGAAPAVVALTNCVDDQRAKPAIAPEEDTQSDDIPKDPFAPVGKR